MRISIVFACYWKRFSTQKILSLSLLWRRQVALPRTSYPALQITYFGMPEISSASSSINHMYQSAPAYLEGLGIIVSYLLMEAHVQSVTTILGLRIAFTRWTI